MEHEQINAVNIKRRGISHFILLQSPELCYYEGIDFISDIQTQKTAEVTTEGNQISCEGFIKNIPEKFS